MRRTQNSPVCLINTLSNNMFKIATCVALASGALAKSVPVAPPAYEARPLSYSFGYGVQENYYPTIFGHDETAEPSVVNGCYSVLLPDGRTQTVRYTADPAGYGGYNPTISYSTDGSGCNGKYVAAPAPPAPPKVYRPAPPPTTPRPPPPPPPPTPVYVRPTPAPTTPAPREVVEIVGEKRVCTYQGNRKICKKVAETDVHADHHNLIFPGQ